MDMEELIKEKCEDACVSPDVLTDAELAKLRKEIEAEQQGYVVLDGVLSNQDLLFRESKPE